MKLSKKAQDALDRMVERFKAGDVAPLVAVAALGLAEDAPARKWSYANRVLAFAMTGSLDCRGYRQWQAAGRQVKKGERGGYILFPRIKKVDGGEDEDEKLVGFGAVAVFGYDQTDEASDNAVTYEAPTPPPLADVAERLGVDVGYGPLLGAYGQVDAEGEKITLNSHDAYPFLHELAHAAEAKLNGKLKGGQEPDQEARAELVAAVLANVYELGDYTGNCWRYVEHYHGDPLKAIQAAASTVGPILELILAPSAG